MSVVEVLQMMYAIVPKEIVLIILGGITLLVLLNLQDMNKKEHK